MAFNYWKKKLYIYKTDKDCFKLVKSRTEHSCSICNSKIPKGSYLYGSNYLRICIDCINEFCENSLIDFKDFINMIKNTQKDLKKNKKKYELNNVERNI